MRNPKAFPSDSRDSGDFAGMDLRDYFAAREKYSDSDHQAFSMGEKEKMMGRPCPSEPLDNWSWWQEFKAKILYMKADIMLDERLK